jgi:hypothetical protein
MTQLTRDDLWSLEEYAAKRSDFRAEVRAHKKNRQLALGEHARLYFEDATTIRYQIQAKLEDRGKSQDQTLKMLMETFKIV